MTSVIVSNKSILIEFIDETIVLSSIGLVKFGFISIGNSSIKISSSACKQNSFGGLSLNVYRWKRGSIWIMSARVK